jgi:peptide chain release factor 2
MENLLKQLEELREQVKKTWSLLGIDRQIVEVQELRFTTENPNFWLDQKKAIETNKKIEALESEINQWQKLLGEITELEQLVAFALKEEDDSVADEAHLKFNDLQEQYNKLDFRVLFSGKYDQNNVILSLHAGTGGVDAQDWTAMLERMYLRFAEKMNWQAEIIDRVVGNEAGIKSSHLRITGRWAYGYLKSENGVHRLVRISPFDAEAMRHTSFALVEVIPELDDEAQIIVKDEDLKIDTYRASGPGGQNVNKTESAIRITHLPTGIVCACQTERSQHQNKETALRILKSKLLKLQEEAKEKEEDGLRGGVQKAEWGKQIRSYVLQPYQLVKDNRTQTETSDINSVLDGSLEQFMESYLRYLAKNKNK